MDKHKNLDLQGKEKRYEKHEKLLALALAVMMLVGMTPLESQAAGKVKWSSSNKNIAKVSGKKYTCKLKVKNPYLSATKKTITQGKSFTLEMKGSTVVKWSSSDKSVATVSSRGVVKAKKKGTAIITCKCKNGKKYKCKVTVKKKSNSGNINGGTVYIGNTDDENTNDETANNGNSNPNTKETKTATRYGYWDTKSARDILEGINEYRREKGLSDLSYQADYEPYMQQQVMHCYFGNSDFDLAPEGKSVRFVSGMTSRWEWPALPGPVTPALQKAEIGSSIPMSIGCSPPAMMWRFAFLRMNQNKIKKGSEKNVSSTGDKGLY